MFRRPLTHRRAAKPPVGHEGASIDMLSRLHRISAATAVVGALAIAAPVAGASATPGDAGALSPYDCMQVMAMGPLAVIGPYGVLGDYGPLGSHAGEPNPVAGCYSGSPFNVQGVTAVPGVN
jgi:hypothetical protein